MQRLTIRARLIPDTCDRKDEVKKSCQRPMIALLLGQMTNDALIDFPFVASLPKREKSKMRKILDRFEELREVTRDKGMLVPMRLVSKVLGVSHQRVAQIVSQGRLETFDVDGHPFVTEVSLMAFAKLERKTGRPFSVSKVKGEEWTGAKEWATKE